MKKLRYLIVLLPFIAMWVMFYITSSIQTAYLWGSIYWIVIPFFVTGLSIIGGLIALVVYALCKWHPSGKP